MDLSYKDRLAALNIYSLERRRERYLIIYIWKILENFVPNFSDPIGHYISERRGRYCITSHIELGCLGSLQFNSFRFKASRLFNSLPKFIRNSSSCTVLVFKRRLDNFLSDVPDDPVQTNQSNSLIQLLGPARGGNTVVS